MEGVVELQVYYTQTVSSACISATCLTSVLYLGSNEDQRAAEARRLFKSNTGYLGFIGDGTKACVRGFSTTCAALSSMLHYRFIPCAAECCALCHIKGTGLRVWQNAGAAEENLSFVTGTEILAHCVEAVIKVCVITLTLS